MHAYYRIVSAAIAISAQPAFPRAVSGASLCTFTALYGRNSMPSIVSTLRIALLQKLHSKLLLPSDVYRHLQSSHHFQQNLDAVSQASIIYAAACQGYIQQHICLCIDIPTFASEMQVCAGGPTSVRSALAHGHDLRHSRHVCVST